MALLKKIKNNLRYRLLKLLKPEIISYIDFYGKRVHGTGISNMSHVSNKKNVQIGKHVIISHFSYIDGQNIVEIGDSCQIGMYVSILTHSTVNNIRYNSDRTKPQNDTLLISKPIKIGNHSFISANSIIQPGTIIGKGSIVAAFSVVSGSFPDYAIIKGNPAKVVGSTKEIDDAYLENHPEALDFYYKKK